MRFLAVFASLAALLAIGCEPVADPASNDTTIQTPDATATDVTTPDSSTPATGSSTTPSTSNPGASNPGASNPGASSSGSLDPNAPGATGTPRPDSVPSTPTPDSDTPGAGSSTTPGATDTTDGEPAPDNTGRNERDADGDTKTPLDQGNSQRDTEITAEIRQQVLEIENASVNARNVKIVTLDGKVTLRGPVETAEERDQIEQIATKVAGEGMVDNQIEVKTE